MNGLHNNNGLNHNCASWRRVLAPGRIGIVLLISMSFTTMGGCASVRAWRQRQWEGDYDTAHKQCNIRGLPILIHYSNAKPGRVDPLIEALADETIDQLTKPYVRCRLYRSFEPDRRFMGQFHVTRSPALVVLRTDGTYHTAVGIMSSEDIQKFLSEAQTPGQTLTVDKNLPHMLDYDWISDISEAQRISHRNGQAMLVVYQQRLTNQGWHLQAVLEKQEVYRRLADMVHCKIDVWKSKEGVFISPFGVIKLPAIVLVDTKGTYDVLEQPMSYEAVVHFADRFLNGEHQPTIETAAATR